MDVLFAIITWAVIIGVISIVEYFVVKAAVNNALNDFSRKQKEEYSYLVSRIKNFIDQEEVQKAEQDMKEE